MTQHAGTSFLISFVLLSFSGWTSLVHAENQPNLRKAMSLHPVQKSVDYEIPDRTILAQCKIETYTMNNQAGWIVRHPAGYLLRRFLDTNADKIVDQWSYYRDGLEIYRDLDTNFNNRTDQYRWFNQGGTRWGIDSNEDGTIDRWRMLSAEEATLEAVSALAEGDFARLNRVLLSESDLKQLQLDKRIHDFHRLRNNIRQQFQKIVQSDQVSRHMQWVRFDGSVPALVPATTTGSDKELLVYQNVFTLTETKEQTRLFYVGEMVRVGYTWKLMTVPYPQTGQTISLNNWLIQSPLANTELNSSTTNNYPPGLQKLLTQLQDLDESSTITSAPGQYHASRSNILEKIVTTVPKNERSQWILQLADELVTGIQSSQYPEGLKRLENLQVQLQKANAPKSLLAMVAYRHMSAVYLAQLQAPNAAYEQIQSNWVNRLKGFVNQNPQAKDTPDAILQLSITYEFADNEPMARQWYQKLAKQFSGSPQALKAKGALRRLNLVGQNFDFKGKGLRAASINAEDYRGQVLLVSFWATWCEPCKTNMKTLQELYQAYHNKGFEILGVNLDSQTSKVNRYVRKSQIGWPQIHEPGGLESRPANELGIITVPSMILVDEKGRVISRDIQLAELETELRRRLN